MHTACFGVLMEKHSDQLALMKSIKEIREVEEKRERLILSAKEEGEKILREAKEKIATERAKMEEELVNYKNEELKKGRADIERQVEEVLAKAKKEAEVLKKKKVDKNKLEKIALSVFE